MERLWTKSFIGLTLTLFFLCFGFYLLLPTLPLYIKQHVNESQVGLIIGIFTLSAVVARPIIGGLLDRYGRRIFMILGLIAFALSMFLYSWVSGIVLILLLRIFHGVSWAMSTTSIGTSITDVIPVSRRGEGMGWYGLAMTVSMAIGPMIGVWIIQGSSFSNLFHLATALTVIALLFALITKVPYSQQEHRVRIEFFDRNVTTISIAIFFLTFAYGGVTTFLPLFAETLQVNAGTFFLVYAIALTLSRPIAGKLADRYSYGFVIIPALILSSVALLVLSLSNGLFGMLTAAILYGIGFGAAQPTLQAATLRLVPAHKKGVANASFFTAIDLGIGIGAIVLGLVTQFMGYHFLFTVCAVSVVVSLLIFTVFVRRKLRSEEDSSGEKGLQEMSEQEMK